MASRITQLAVEVVSAGGLQHRVTQAAVEVVSTGGLSHRVTQAAVEVVHTGTLIHRITQTAVEMVRASAGGLLHGPESTGIAGCEATLSPGSDSAGGVGCASGLDTPLVTPALDPDCDPSFS